MVRGEASSARNGGSGKRISLACLECRNKHIRCDGTKPICNRCTERDTQCEYGKSRRGGLDRAALAARRQRVAVSASNSSGSPSLNSSDNPFTNESMDTPGTGDGLNFQHSPDDVFGVPLLNPFLVNMTSDPFIDMYYNCFHKFHPCVLPRKRLAFYLNDASNASRLRPVTFAIRFIGSLYSRSSQCNKLRQETADAIAEARRMPSEPFLTQAQLLYSVALFWSGDRQQARQYLDDALSLAVDLGMFKQEFAAAYGEGDAVLEESWRRTWWQIYLVDASYFHIQRNSSFPSKDVPATADLPCEEPQYELGDIPPPASLEGYDTREFCTDERKFSSFAHLIGLNRCTTQALTSTPWGMKGSPPLDVVEAVDAASDGWLRLLPESKQKVMSDDGEIDELAFVSLLALHAVVVTVHRPYSSLQYNPLEQISSCARSPFSSQKSSKEQDIHTTRCFHSIKEQIRLMMLPKQTFCHSPFVICMVTTGIIPYLSACKFVLSGRKLALARDQIRLSIGCLKSLADIWPQGSKTVKEIQEIAQEVLGLRQSRRTDANVANNTDNTNCNDGLYTDNDNLLDNMDFLDSVADLPLCWDMGAPPVQPFTS